jgi:RING finger protein 113A
MEAKGPGTAETKEENKVENSGLKIKRIMVEGPVATFFKSRKGPSNPRKRGETESTNATQEEDSNVVRKRKTEVQLRYNLNINVQASGLTATTKGAKEKEDLTYKSSGSVQLGAETLKSNATAALETETEFDKDYQGVMERKIQSQKKDDHVVVTGEEAESAEKLYKGMTTYHDLFEQKEKVGLGKGMGIRAGPMRTVTNIRVTSRFDYQQDLCKDYKETGYCGFGDACKFVHDRGDYKTGWQLEQEWDDQQKQLRKGKRLEKPEEKPEDDMIPFVCPICRKGFTDPVTTRCKHNFCEDCALKEFKKNKKCFTCGENTQGAFTRVGAKIKERMKEKLEDAKKRGIVSETGEVQEQTVKEGAEDEED